MIFVRFINMINRIIHAGTKWTRICQICRPSLSFCYGRWYSCILLWIFVYRLITLLLENNAAPILRTDFLYLKIMFSFINFISTHFQNTFKPANCRVAKIRRGRKHTGRYLFWICHENSDLNYITRSIFYNVTYSWRLLFLILWSFFECKHSALVKILLKLFIWFIIKK